MRILVVHEVSYTRKPIFEYHEFPELLSRNGHEIGVYQFDEGKKRLFLDPLEQKRPMRLSESGQLTIFSPGFGGTSLAARLLAVFSTLLHFPLVLIRFKPDLILNYSVPTFGLTANLAAIIFRIPIVYRALDVSHKIRPTRLAPLIRTVERLVYGSSTHISTHNAALAEYCAKTSFREVSISIEYPPVQDSIFDRSPYTQEQARSSFDLPTKGGRVFLVLGSLFKFCGVDKLITVFSSTTNHKDHLIIVGSGYLESKVRELAADIPRVRVFEPLEFHELPRAFSASDYSLIPFEQTLEADCALPQRALLSLAAGVPVVSLPLKGLSREFGGFGVQIVPHLEAMLEVRNRIWPKPIDKISLREKIGVQASVTRFEQMLQAVKEGRVVAGLMQTKNE